MNKKGLFFVSTILILSLLVVIWYAFYFRSNREIKLMKEGERIVNKVEEYKKTNDRLPNSLSEIGIEEREGFNVLYYYKRDSINYTVSFPISAEKHKFYYSDSKKWEDGYRDMK